MERSWETTGQHEYEPCVGAVGGWKETRGATRGFSVSLGFKRSKGKTLSFKDDPLEPPSLETERNHRFQEIAWLQELTSHNPNTRYI